MKPRLVRRARRSRSTSAETYTTPQPEKAVSEAISSVQKTLVSGAASAKRVLEIYRECTQEELSSRYIGPTELLTHGHKERPR